MITIEQVIEFFEQDYYTGDNWEFVNNKEAAAVVRAQHEEIERLKRQLDMCEKIKLRLPPDLNDLVNETIERSAQVCDYLTGRNYDFDMGRLHCAEAIRALKSGEPK